jgi:transcriptional regulator with XRE-family HTH domain
VSHRLIDPAQIRAARALLDISQTDLALASEVGIATIKRLEGAPDVLRVTAGVLLRVQTALERAGVEFIFEDEMKGSGVRLKRGSRVEDEVAPATAGAAKGGRRRARPAR